jgi:hypothetical protein
MSTNRHEPDGFNEAAADRLGLSKAARELAQGAGLDPERGNPEPPDVTEEDRARLAEDPGAVDDVVARLSRKPTVLGKALRNDDIYVWVVGVVLVGVVAAWIFK